MGIKSLATTRTEVVALGHISKVAIFLFVSGGLTFLLENIGKLDLSPALVLIVSGAINLAIAYFKKYWDLEKGK